MNATGVPTPGFFYVDAIARGTATLSGKKVTFFIGSKLATQSGTWTDGENTNLNLSA